jgi:DNA-binding HxlR family transcriptional regulator
MARGKKYNDEAKEKALAMLATNNNMAELSKELNIPVSTLCTWKKEHEDNEEFEKLRMKKKSEFISKAWESIEDALKLGNKRVKRALEHEEELDKIIELLIEDNELSNITKQSLIQKLKALQVQGIRDISTYIGTLYDKAALAAGEATVNTDMEINITLSDD